MFYVSIIASLFLGALSASVAKKKGYNPVIWFLGGTGILGLIVISVLSDTESLHETAQQPEKRKGNIIGALMILISLLGIVFVFSLQ
ncbi:MAG: hypothetical protein KDE31_36050 [Caldilineaceae bacterium]|nr:hypothetical protein [Caldilineaceae bacterium]